MKCHDAEDNHSVPIVHKKFGELKDGDIFRQEQFIQVKVKNYFRINTDETQIIIKPINSITIGILRQDQRHSYIGKYSFFNDDTEVEYYPNAALYLGG